MKRAIHKYELRPITEQTVSMPGSARILCVQVQRDTPCLWALVDTDKELFDRTIITLNTGQEIEPPGFEGEYIGTYQLMGGTLVKHVYEKL